MTVHIITEKYTEHIVLGLPYATVWILWMKYSASIRIYARTSWHFFTPLLAPRNMWAPTKDAKNREKPHVMMNQMKGSHRIHRYGPSQNYCNITKSVPNWHTNVEPNRDSDCQKQPVDQRLPYMNCSSSRLKAFWCQFLVNEHRKISIRKCGVNLLFNMLLLI